MTDQFKIEAMGSKVLIVGERGAWDAMLHIRFAGQDFADTRTYPVRAVNGRAEFNKLKLRDEARNVRDCVQIALLLGEEPVYAQVCLNDNNVSAEFGADHCEMFPNYPSCRVAIVSFRGSEFQSRWKIPRNASLLAPRWQIDLQTTNQERS